MCLACSLPAITLDERADRKPKAGFSRARKVESRYGRLLRHISRQIGVLTESVYDPSKPETAATLEALLRRYADTIDPWARSVGERITTEVAQRDLAQWNTAARAIGSGLRKQIEQAPIGGAIRASMAEQARLIKSLPLEAAERVHKLALEGIVNGTRAGEIAKEIMRAGEVSESRANTIARTEVSRLSTELVKARAQYVGSTHFRWRTVGDSDVRPDHKKLNNEVFRWDDPPVADERTGAKALPGAIYNCRCWPEPILDE